MRPQSTEDVPPSLRRVRPHRQCFAWASATVMFALAAGVLTGCGNSGGGGSTVSPRPTPPNTASFSSHPLPSSASSAIASARASASAAASSASARASEFEASVSAETARRAAAAEKALKGVKGGGNARSEVSLTGVPRTQTGGVLASLVTITNKTDRKASYAVQVDFLDAHGHVVETRYAGAENLEPGKREQPIVFSRKPPEPKLTPRLTKAERY
ncbi:FxLYD domain-containing protein [Streptomyces sp. NPDC056190]|uniref:FxLYD domain-containing protein n=1 Tax=Streptomyces sp. NPDC056190 TaxID=3345741 RepID=UPI0035DE9FE6